MTLTSTVLREAVIYQYVFLAASLEASGGRKRPPDANALSYLERVLDWQDRWLHRAPPDGCPRPALAALDDADAELWLYPPNGEVDWIAASDRKRAGFTVARLTGGAILLQQGIGQPEEALPGVWDELRTGLWAPDQVLRESAHFLGCAVCYGGRVSDEEEARRQAEVVLCVRGSNQAVPVRCVPLSFGGWLCDRPGLRDTLALFYPDDPEAENAAGTYFNTIFPALLLYPYKVTHEYEREYEGNLRKRLEHQERILARVLAETRAPSNDLTRLEGQLKELAEAHGAFASDLASFQRLQQSVAVNAANLEEVFATHVLPRSGFLAARQARVTKDVRQMEADDRLYRAATTEADVSLRAIQVQAELERARVEREENDLTEKRNALLSFGSFIATILGTLIGVSNLVSDETGRALVNWWYGKPAEAVPSQFAVFIARLLLTVVIGASVCVPVLVYWYRSLQKAGKRSGPAPG